MVSTNSTELNHNSKMDRLFALDEQNKKCTDCHNEPVAFLSINNGVTLCQECATKHSDFGSAISYLRKIDEELDDYLYNYYVFGGNTKFQNCLQLFSIESSLEIQKKYHTYGVDYYRRNLKAKVKGLKPIDNIDFSLGPHIKEVIEDDYPEFHNYQLLIKDNPKGMSKLKGLFGQLTTKVSDFNIKEKLTLGKNSAIEKITKVGQYVANTTAPTANKIKTGASYFSSSVQSVYNGVKDKIVKKRAEDSNNQGVPLIKEDEAGKTFSFESNKTTQSTQSASIIPKEMSEMPSSLL